jgi:hypothetical protein
MILTRIGTGETSSSFFFSATLLLPPLLLMECFNKLGEHCIDD